MSNVRLIDLTRQSMGWNNPHSTRATSQIRRIGVHHSATNVGSQRVFENHWRTLGWRNGGYHEIILTNGDVEICYPPTVVTNGVGGHNADSYHICVVGNFRPNGAQPTAAQMRSLLERIRVNMSRLNVPVDRVLGHNEFPNHRANTCPGQNMTTLRNQLRQPAPSPNNQSLHVVRSGETLSTIARQHRTTVADLQRLNNIANPNLIRVGQTLRLPNATATPPPTNSTIRVGSRVRVNSNAQRWATNQVIPAWVRGNAYTVQQMRNNNNELLLSGVMSWARRSDVTLI